MYFGGGLGLLVLLLILLFVLPGGAPLSRVWRRRVSDAGYRADFAARFWDYLTFLLVIA